MINNCFPKEMWK